MLKKLRREGIIMNQKVDKLESITEQSQSTMEIKKALASMQYGSEEELEQAIEQYLEKRTSASSASVPLTEVGNMIEQLDEKINYIYQSLAQKNEEQAERLAGLISVTNFESTLTERLVQRKYYFDPKANGIYEELRGSILQSMAQNHGKSNIATLLELKEKLRIFEMEQSKLQTENDKVKKEMKELRAKNILKRSMKI
jgi:molybdopterin-biosynthesis enzyme MoeA-like protein